MFENLTVSVAAVVAASAAVAAPVAIGLAPRVDMPAPAPVDRPAPPPDEPLQRQEPEAPRPDHPDRSGRLDVGVDDDGARLLMRGHDPSGASGGAGISMTDDGFHLELEESSAEGSGSAGVAMNDDGFQLWFDVDQSQ